MSQSVQVRSIDEACRQLTGLGAKHISIDVKLHRVKFKRNGDNDSLLVTVQTDDELNARQIAQLATLSLEEHKEQRQEAVERFVEFMTTCSARRIMWICPSVK